MDRRGVAGMSNCSFSNGIIVSYNNRWPLNNFVWSKGFVKLSARNLFGVIPAYANEIGAEVLPDCSIEPNAFHCHLLI